jgi:hypothetical protein
MVPEPQAMVSRGFSLTPSLGAPRLAPETLPGFGRLE